MAVPAPPKVDLLPRMEARSRVDGLTTYRYHPVGEKPINLGTERALAVERAQELIGIVEGSGTIGRLWRQYQDTPAWRDLRSRTQDDYRDHWRHLLPVFGATHAKEITAPRVARYLRHDRGTAPVRANREIALLGNLIGLAIERGEARANPCRGGQVKRNRERPLDVLPSGEDIQALVAFAATRDAAVKMKIGRSVVVMMAAEFAALTGARQAELLPLEWPAFGEAEVRLIRAKQRRGVTKTDRVEVSPALAALRMRLLSLQRSSVGPVFPNRAGNAYTARGFAAMWQRLMIAAIDAGAVQTRFNFHALRAWYVTEHKARVGCLPEMHASPATTARIYERSQTALRSSLSLAPSPPHAIEMTTYSTIILTPNEIAAITGFSDPTRQLRELKRLGFHRARRAIAGHLILERVHYEAVCVGPRHPSTQAKSPLCDISTVMSHRREPVLGGSSSTSPPLSQSVPLASSRRQNAQKITVAEWAALTYSSPPSAWVLGKWRRLGQIYPPPERVGREWVLPETAERIVGQPTPDLVAKLRRTR